MLNNYLKTSIAPQEHCLIKEEIEELDELIEPAETTLTWNSEHIWPYVERLRNTANDLNSRVKKAQENVKKVQNIVSKWESEPLFVRIKDPKSEPLLNLNDREERKDKRYKEIAEATLKIQELLEENKKLFKANITLEL